jgi:hypothetical protein
MKKRTEFRSRKDIAKMEIVNDQDAELVMQF